MENKLYNLFLDDVRIPKGAFDYTKNPIYLNEEWVIVRSYNDFVNTITDRGLPYMVSFDHDLADAHYHESMYEGGKIYFKYLETVSEKSGSDCVKWLVEHCMNNGLEFPMWYIHSKNPVGAEFMRDYIKSYLRSLTMESLPSQECDCNEQCQCKEK